MSMSKRKSLRMSVIVNNPILPSDCIEEILKSLDKDRSSLYSWTLVNRSWCQYAIALLWSHPFTSLNLSDDQDTGHLLIRTYLTCLSSEARQALEAEGHVLPNSKPLFDYPSYFKELHIGSLQNALEQWWTKNTDYRLRKKANFTTLESLIFEMLINKSNGLRLLHCESRSRYNMTDCTSFTGIQKAVTRIQELRINCSSVDQGQLTNLLSTIIENSHQIHRLVLTPHHEGTMAQKVPKLIEAQQCLEQFSMISSLAGLFNPSRSASIFSALTSQIKSLTHADFRKIYFDENSLQILAKCHNLKSLYLVNCHQEQDITLSDSLLKSGQLSITKLVLNHDHHNSVKDGLSQNTCTSIIMMSAQTLQELSIDYINSDLVQILSTQIPHLTSFSIRTTPISQLEWISTSTLTHLALSDVGPNSSIAPLKHIGQLLPPTLTHLQLECRYNIAPESMAGMLDDCQTQLKILSLDVEKIDDTLLEVVADYSRENGKCVRELRIAKDTRLQFDQRLCKKLQSVIPSINLNYVDPWPLLIGE
ncbi:3448_t:CDS:1 [Scutellospora calospora]|uniref:3448_t:CDS:1 n=1 Tax=Scutellospora calospora TaxID=85575 RepID=A0ACA9KRN6_9GLOM|nr:3448_t:CDS:1 [Scutellospora calospora]